MGETSDFIVFDTHRDGYVESIDTYDGDVEITNNRQHARIFRGETWREFWVESADRGRYQLSLPG